MEVPVEIAKGLFAETVGDIIEGRQPQPQAVPAFEMPVLPGYPVDWPGEGLFFGMPDHVYHSIPALSTGGTKKMASSPMLFWASCPWLNENYEEREAEEHFDVGHAYHCRILEGAEEYAKRYAIGLDKKQHPNALDTLKDIRAAYPEGIKPKGASKRECFDNLKQFDGTVELWDDLLAEHERANEGKTMIPAKINHQIEIAAAMIEKDPELGQALTGGYPEVSFFWICAKTGVPMKARVDYLKIKTMVDLKSLQNTQERSIENAIRMDIANRRYGLQPSVYFEGAREVRKLVREKGSAAITVWGAEGVREAEVEWAKKWAAHTMPDEWLFIYQQKGIAPVTRGLFWPRGGTTKMLCDDIVLRMKRRFRDFAETFGTDPWIDHAPIYDLDDESLPPWTTEI
jgi:hypothetical protein